MKKGISQLIATVLILGFTVALAAVIWSRDFQGLNKPKENCFPTLYVECQVQQKEVPRLHNMTDCDVEYYEDGKCPSITNSGGYDADLVGLYPRWWFDSLTELEIINELSTKTQSDLTIIFEDADKCERYHNPVWMCDYKEYQIKHNQITIQEIDINNGFLKYCDEHQDECEK